jgi:hypothetical protein
MSQIQDIKNETWDTLPIGAQDNSNMVRQWHKH